MSSHLFAFVYHLWPAYGVITIVLGLTGLSRDIQRSTPSADMLCFRRSRLLRLACAAFALLCIWTGLLMVGVDVYHYVRIVGPGGDSAIWYGFLPTSIFLALFCLWAAGPQYVRIDLDSRVCHATTGWPCIPRRFNFPLDDTSLYVYPGGQGCYLALGVMADKEYRFVLATADGMDTAQSQAQDLGDQLGLPVRVTTFYGMRQDIARKR